MRNKGDDRFKPIFDAVKRRGEFARQVKNLYREGRVPLAVAANIGGTTGFEFWEAVRGDPEMLRHPGWPDRLSASPCNSQ